MWREEPFIQKLVSSNKLVSFVQYSPDSLVGQLQACFERAWGSTTALVVCFFLYKRAAWRQKRESTEKLKFDTPAQILAHANSGSMFLG